MAEEKANLGTVPEALGKRQVTVTLSDGTTVVVHKWSRPKFLELLAKVGVIPEAPTLAEQSVAEADRERVRALDFEDILAVAQAAQDLNVTPGILKNLPAYLEQRRGIENALGLKSPTSPSSQS